MGLGSIVKELEKKYKRVNPDLIYNPKKQIEWVSSQNLIYDLITGGGFPKERLTEICAWEGLGKTSLLMKSHAAVQKEGKNSIFVDFEGTFNAQYAESIYGLKVDQDTFILLQPENAEQGIELLDDMLNQAEENKVPVEMVSIDSIAACKPQSLIDLAVDENGRIAIHAKTIALLVDKLRIRAKRQGFAVVLINQFRGNPASSNSYSGPNNALWAGGVNETAYCPGGNAPRYYASIRMKMEYGGQVKPSAKNLNNTDIITGEAGAIKGARMIKFTNIKNKVARPELKGLATFEFVNMEQKCGGWNNARDVYLILKARGRITQAAGTLTYHGNNEYSEYKIRANAEEAEAIFLSDVKLVKDATELVKTLCSTSHSTLLGKAIKGVDYSNALTDGQDEINSELSEEDKKVVASVKRKKEPNPDAE